MLPGQQRVHLCLSLRRSDHNHAVFEPVPRPGPKKRDEHLGNQTGARGIDVLHLWSAESVETVEDDGRRARVIRAGDEGGEGRVDRGEGQEGERGQGKRKNTW